MAEKFESYMVQVGNDSKRKQLRELFDKATTVGKLEMLGTLEAFFTRF